MLLCSSLVIHFLILETTTISTPPPIFGLISILRARPSSNALLADSQMVDSSQILLFAGLPIIPTYLQPGKRKFTDGVNFASGGAGALVESHQGFVVDLETQIKYFNKVEKSLRQELGDAGAKKLMSKAVYLISIGGNDYFTKNSSVSDEEFVSMVLGNLTVALKVIYSWGSCIDELTAIAKLHSAELLKTLVKLQNQLEGFKYAYYNLYQSFTERLNDPSKYGFKDATTACCGSGPYGGVYSCGGKRGIQVYELCDKPGDYFFFDSYHPSEKAYRQFAELMWAGNTDIVWPYNLKMLFQDNAFYCTDQFSISMP
ncbi:hypothetical protein Gotri_009377 [Gossypium trilobum]|uniref:GDSL esterase/lipase 1-like n=1 Tax=Gossypium trilobum TaxID=34281 RepID=A0A7J9EM73_9ROSI|nr:hypothetical protein [Gossypium trilobum]